MEENDDEEVVEEEFKGDTKKYNKDFERLMEN